MVKPGASDLSCPRISQTDLSAFVSCPIKYQLIAKGAEPSDPEFMEGESLVAKQIRPLQLSYLADHWRTSQYQSELHNKHWLESVEESQVVLDWPVHSGVYISTLDALQVVVSRASKRIIPVRFFPELTVTERARMLLCFDAIVIESSLGPRPREGIAILGWEPRSTTIKFSEAMRQRTEKYISELLRTSSVNSDNPGRTGIVGPQIRLNAHCSVCQYQGRCFDEAKAADDLTLLSAMSSKEQDRMRNRGIFTVNQYSYTFKMRRDKKALERGRERRQHALTALAMRDQKTYVLGEPQFALAEGDVFVDVEGDLSRGFYYLIGVLQSKADKLAYTSFWANDKEQEQEMFQKLVRHLVMNGCNRIIHYGAYESDFLRKMLAKHELPTKARISLEAIGTHNLLKTIYDHIYFPCRTNSLKVIGTMAGAFWRYPKASGARANFWRIQWEVTKQVELKSRLIDYNEDDCRALAQVAETVARLCKKSDSTVQSFSAEEALAHRYSRPYACSDFDLIANAAHWDRQHNLLYVGRRRPNKEKKAQSKHSTLPTKTLSPQPYNFCPKCGSKLYKTQRYARIVLDLTFRRSSVSAYRCKYVRWRLKCRACKTALISRCDPWPTSKFGVGLVAFFVYELIEHVGLARSVARMMLNVFAIRITGRYIIRSAAEFYLAAYGQILSDLQSSHVIHSDETNVRTRDGAGYVWVLCNCDSVYFYYEPTREPTTAKNLLAEYRGVAITDFYCGYDSLNCRQQKCLIHLMRDFNDDLLKQPFNNELRVIADRFSHILKTAIEAIEKQGSNRKALASIIPVAEDFVRDVCELQTADQASPLLRYKERFSTYKDRLFEFLRHDSVSWNNNFAEHAIKEFARIRDQIDGMLTPTVLRDYLVLLSVTVTCKYRDIPVLKFLASGATQVPKHK